MDQTSGTNPTDAPPAQGPQESLPAEPQAEDQPGFRSRGQARRRARFLRRARELAYRDLGGLVFNLHRFGQRNDALVLAKLGTLGHIDGELRAIETALGERRPVTVLREAGITACPRCAAIHGSEDRYCPNCGLPMSRHADLPVAGAPAGDQPAAHPALATVPRTGAPAVPPGMPSPPPAMPRPAAPAFGASSSQQAPGTAATGALAEQSPVPAQTPSVANESPETAPQRDAGVPGQPPVPAQSAQPGENSGGEAAVPAVAGRSPVPPARRPSGEPATPGADLGPEEPTEIIHPPAQGS